MTQKGFSPLIVILFGALLIILIGGFYFYKFGNFKSQPQTPTTSLTSKESSPPSYPPPSPTQVTTTNIPSQIKITPKNASGFELDVVTSDNCNNPIGATTYMDKTTGADMVIWSELLKGSNDTKLGLAQLNKLLDSTLTYKQDLDPIELVFHSYCGGSHTAVIREIPNIVYSGMDKVKAAMVTEAQSIYGTPHVYIFGKKGDNYFRINEEILDNDKVQQIINTCEAKQQDLTANYECYQQAIISDKTLEQKAIQEAKNLTELFAIQ